MNNTFRVQDLKSNTISLKNQNNQGSNNADFLSNVAAIAAHQGSKQPGGWSSSNANSGAGPGHGTIAGKAFQNNFFGDTTTEATTSASLHMNPMELTSIQAMQAALVQTQQIQ